MKQLRAGTAAILAALALGWAANAVAQDTAAPAPATTAPPADDAGAIGPAQLRDFSLNGTVTRRADPPVTTAQPSRPAGPAPTQPRVSGSQTERRAETSEGRAPDRRENASTVATADVTPRTALPIELQPPTPADLQPVATTALAPAAIAPDNDESTAVLGAAEGTSFVPWLLALLAALAGAWYFFLRPRQRYAVAGGLEFEAGGAGASEPGPSRVPKPVPAPKPSPRTMPESRTQPLSPSGGIVSTRLRPWLDIELAPTRAIVNERGSTIEFELLIRNTGAAPARDVLIEAGMFNAGPDQDDLIGAFFAHQQTGGERLQQILPMQQVAIKNAVTLPIAKMKQFEIGGRKLFVPVLAINVAYRWSAGRGQTGVSYTIGRDGQGEKLAPLRLDLGPRVFRGLGARENAARLRD